MRIREGGDKDESQYNSRDNNCIIGLADHNHDAELYDEMSGYRSEDG